MRARPQVRHVRGLVFAPAAQAGRRRQQGRQGAAPGTRSQAGLALRSPQEHPGQVQTGNGAFGRRVVGVPTFSDRS